MQKISFRSVLLGSIRLCVLSVLLALMPLCQALHAEENPYVRAEIFFMQWDIETRERLSPNDVRTRVQIKTVISDPFDVGSLVRWLGLEKMEGSTLEKFEDARLVIDLFDKSGGRTTFYASRFNLLSADGRKWREIDPQFRGKFTFGTPGS